jgi:hypothetical protein
MERREYGMGGKPQRLVAQDPQEPQGFYPVTKVQSTTSSILFSWRLVSLQQVPRPVSGCLSVMPNHAQGLRFLPGDPLTVTCDFDSSERDQPTPAGSGSKVRVIGFHMGQALSLGAIVCCSMWQYACMQFCGKSAPIAMALLLNNDVFTMQNEMCNMYMMVTSEIPYFMACGNR